MKKYFFVDDLEIKTGYLNINGLREADHAVYLNNDKHLLNLDLLVIAETKLTEEKQMEICEKLFLIFS